ncbi:MAG: MarC family protein [Holosporales bacterium]|jgi:multiple antibiotic resistance protein|nr:MarC family protein [Holosporales bacterium]
MFTNLSAYLIKLFFVINPHLSVPLFMCLTQKYTEQERKIAAIKTGIFSFCFGVLFIFCGNPLLSALGISFPVFRIAGGFLVGVAGWGLLYSNDDEPKQDSSCPTKSDITICPLTFPMLIGPATLITCASLMQEAKVLTGNFDYTLLLALGLLLILTCMMFLCGSIIMRFLGKNGGIILSKVGGILVVAIAIQMIVSGAKAAFMEQPQAPISQTVNQLNAQ